MEASETDLKEWRKQEKQLRNTINAIAKFVQCFRRSAHENQIEVRLENLENAMRKFYGIRRKIELFVEEEDAKLEVKETKEEKVKRLEALAIKRDTQNAEILEAVEEQYYEIKAGLISLRPKKAGQSNTAAATEAVEEMPVSRVKLPDIRLPTFNGKVKEWVTFRDTFRSLIHDNGHLTEVDKFTYLRASLSGDAFQDITSVALTANNYEVAWNLLERKYENKKLIVKAHLDAIFVLEPLKKENGDALAHLINEVDKNLQMLKKIGEDVDHWSSILAHIVCSRLDSSTLRLWESHHNSKEVPKYEQLSEFLRDQCLVLQTISPAKSNEREVRGPKCSSTYHTTSQDTPQRRCLFCVEGYHTPFKCNKFKSLHVQQRADEVNRKRLCRNCLAAGHFAEGCSRGSCTRCGRKHHTLLHFDNTSSVPRSIKSSVPHTSLRSQPTENRNTQQHQSRPQVQIQNTMTQPNIQTTNSYPVTHAATQNIHTPTTTDQRTTDTKNIVKLPMDNNFIHFHQVLMSTAIVCVEDQWGNKSYARTLLDSCSEYCYISSSFSKTLKLRETSCLLKVQGIGNGSVNSTKFVEATVRPRSASISTFSETMRFHVLRKIGGILPTSPVKISQWPL